MKASDLFPQSSNVAVGGEIADDAPVGTITDKIGYSDPKWLPLDGAAQITPLTVPGSIYTKFDQMAGVTRFNTELSFNGFEEYQPANFPGVVDTATYGVAGYHASRVAFSDDGSLLAVFVVDGSTLPLPSNDFNTLHVYDTATWNPVFQGLPMGETFTAANPIFGRELTFSPDNAFLALYTNMGDVIVLETTTWTPVLDFFGGNTGSLPWCVFSPDSDLFVFVVTAGGTGTKYQIYRTDTWERIPGGDDNTTNPHHLAAVEDLGASPLDPWNIHVRAFRFAPDMSYALFTVAFADTSKLLAWNIVDKYDYNTWTPKPLPITETFETSAPFTTIMFAGDGSNLLFLGSDFWTSDVTFAVVDVANWEILHARPLGELTAVRRSEIYLHPDTATIILGEEASQNRNFLLLNYQDLPHFPALERSLSDTYAARTFSVTMNPVTGHLVAGLSSLGAPPYLRIYRPKVAQTGIVLPDAGSDNTLSPEVPFKIKVLP